MKTLLTIWRRKIRDQHAALGHGALIRRTESALNHFIAFAGDVAMDVITDDLVDKFRVWLLQSGLGKETARNYHLSIRSLVREIDPNKCKSRRGVVVSQSCQGGGSVWEHFERYLGERETSASYRDQLRWAIGDLERFHGQSLDLVDLTPELVNGWLAHMHKRGLSCETRKSRRRMILTIWRDAADAGLVVPPRRIGKVRGTDRIIHAWTPRDVKRLVAACNELQGKYRNGIPKRLYWRAYVLAAWDSGLRGCDLRRLERKAIQGDGCCVIIQHKTGRRIRFRLRKSTIKAINATYPPKRELCFPRWSRLEYWRREAQRLVQLAGLVGGIGLLRHSSGTAVEREHPGRGHEHLGNTRQVFEKHYLDLDQVAFERPLPPAVA